MDQSLFGKINEIKSRAEESETMVQELCRDIKSLDFAKKNVSKTVVGITELLNLGPSIAFSKTKESRVLISNSEWR